MPSKGTAGPAGPAAGPPSPKDKTVPNGTSRGHDPTSAGEQLRALNAARHLAEHGVPIFVAKRDPSFKIGFKLPREWQTTVADPAAVDAWHLGDALCAVMGHTVDGADFDTQKDADVIEAATSLGLLPRAYGVAATPSGGRHHLIASLGVRSHDGVLPAFDVKAGAAGDGHGFLFIAPTVKPSKVTGELAAYRWIEPPDLEPLTLVGGDDSGAALRTYMSKSDAPNEYTGPSYDGPAFSELKPGLQAIATQHVAEQEQLWRGRFAEALTWDDKRRDEKDRGWEGLARDWAWACARMAVAPWTALDARTGEALHDDVLPPEIAADEKCAGKWSAALVAKAASKPIEPPPWDGLSELPAPASTAPSGGWSPVDLTSYLDGTHQPLEPTLLRRDDDVALLYPGMTHSLHGESESGKSMIAQYECVQQMLAGEDVLYVDYEADAGSVTERMLLMGATRELIAKHLTYINPEIDPSQDEATRAAFASLLGRRFALAVLDGVNEALTQTPPRDRSAGGLGGNDDITAWADRLPKRIAKATGAAVVMIDHVAKSENAGRFAIGGQAKMASLTGAAYVVRPSKPIGKGMTGTIELWVAKDRHGYVRQHANPEYTADRLQHAATVKVDGIGRLTVEVVAPTMRPSDSVLKLHMQANVRELLAQLPNDHDGLSVNAIKSAVTGKDAQIAAALKALVEQDEVTIQWKSQSKLHRLVAKQE